MIFISSACSKKKYIGEAVEELALQGFLHIELSGGTKYYKNYENDLLHLKQEYGLQYLLHNYFPPPQHDFVINLASADNTIHQQSLNHLQRAIDLSHRLNLKKFGFHAGFFLDIPSADIGKKLNRQDIIHKEKALDRFCNGYEILQKDAGNIELYIENNVYSATNFTVFGENKPFMLLCHTDFKKLQERIRFKLLLDIGHLLVSSQTLNLNFKKELQSLAHNSDYLHLSDNDGQHDLNMPLIKDTGICRHIQHLDLQHKIITLEIYQGIEATRQSLTNISTLATNLKDNT